MILTVGDRPVELIRSIASIRSQRTDPIEVIVVANGADLHVDDDLGADVVIPTDENLGIPGGRNRGALSATGDLLLFLDDDAELIDDRVVERARDRFAANPDLAVVALRIVDHQGVTARRHVPRIGGGSADRSGYVAGFLGGAVIIRAAAFDSVGGYDTDLWYSMEETDLSWRLIDRRWSIWYDAAPSAIHPRTEPSRHEGHLRRTARNRVRIAWRSLPLPLVPAYLVTWMLISLARRSSLGAMWSGTIDGWKDRPIDRCPMSWSTVWSLVRLGRPPIV